MTPAEYVIDKFGGLTGTARAVGLPVSTVQGWKERGRIPQQYWRQLIDAATKLKDREKLIRLEDFLEGAA